uniref:Chitin-binding type-2 domain-containing protein n=1 Tax=Steinernema glaseri TaxID=37863 RepID=A0A1I7Y236_9BILA
MKAVLFCLLLVFGVTFLIPTALASDSEEDRCYWTACYYAGEYNRHGNQCRFGYTHDNIEKCDKNGDWYTYYSQHCCPVH